jgi:hypothetical protein
LTFDGNTPDFASELRIFTDRYTIVTDAYGKGLKIFGQDKLVFDPKVSVDGLDTPHANFIAALENRATLAAPVRYGVMLSALMDALYESAQTGAMVKVKPVPEQFSAEPPGVLNIRPQ